MTTTTTTIIPHAETTLDVVVDLTSPFHHGAGSSGNTSILRTQDVIQPDGTVARVPFLSSGSIRHALRDALTWHTVHTIGVEPESLSKILSDVLWSGGAVSQTGARTDLEMMRRVEKYYPALMLLGYAAKSSIITGALRASDCILVCAENDWRLPEGLRGRRRAAAYRTEEFGTRHDQATSQAGRYITIAEDADIGTAQMIWDIQALAAGSRLYGTLSLTPAATPMQKIAFYAALELWAPKGKVYLGAKTAQGYGAGIIRDWAGYGEALESWTRHLDTHAEEIKALLGELGE